MPLPSLPWYGPSPQFRMTEPRRMADADARRTGLAADERRAALMAAAQAGDGAAYQAVLRDCTPIVQAIARRPGGPAAPTAHAVPETLLLAQPARHTHRPRRPRIGCRRRTR